MAIFPLFVTKPLSTHSAFKHSCSKTEMPPGFSLPAWTPCPMPPLSTDSCGAHPCQPLYFPLFLLLWFLSPIFWSCQFSLSTPFPFVPAFVPPWEQWSTVSSHIISKTIWTSLLGLKINMILIISDLTGKIIIKFKHFSWWRGLGSLRISCYQRCLHMSLQLWSEGLPLDIQLQ